MTDADLRARLTKLRRYHFMGGDGFGLTPDGFFKVSEVLAALLREAEPDKPQNAEYRRGYADGYRDADEHGKINARMREAEPASSRWACLKCSTAAGVVLNPSHHVSHAVGERCPREAEPIPEPTAPSRCPACNSPDRALRHSVPVAGLPALKICESPWHHDPLVDSRS